MLGIMNVVLLRREAKSRLEVIEVLNVELAAFKLTAL